VNDLVNEDPTIPGRILLHAIGTKMSDMIQRTLYICV